MASEREQLLAVQACLERIGRVHEIEGLMVEPLSLLDALLAQRASAAGAEETQDLRQFRFHPRCEPLLFPPEWTKERHDAFWADYWRNY